MRPRSLLVLLLIVVGLAAFIWFFERDLPSTEARQALVKKVLRVEADEITAISLRTDLGRARLERVKDAGAGGDEEAEDDSAPAVARQSSWRLTEPLAARADSAAVDQLLDSLLELKKERTLDEVDAAAVGLETPRAEIVLESPAGDHRLRIGAEIPVSRDMILAVEDTVYAVASGIWSQVDKPPGDWRDRDVVPFDRDRIERIELSGAAQDPPVVFARRGEEFWLESPVPDRADAELVDELLADLEGLRAEEFIDDPEAVGAGLGLDPPRGSIELAVADDDESFRLTLGAEKEGESGKLYARAGGQVFTSGDELRAAVERPVGDWRSAMWSLLEVYQIDSLVVRDAAGELAIRRDGADWLRGEDRVEDASVRDFIYSVTSAAADGFLDSDRQALGVPELTIELIGGERRELLELYAASEGGVPATVSTREAILLLPPATADEVRLGLEETRNAEPLPEEDSPLGEGGGA